MASLDLNKLQSGDQFSSAKDFLSANSYDVVMVNDQHTSGNMEKGLQVKEGQFVVVADAHNVSSNSFTSASVNLT